MSIYKNAVHKPITTLMIFTGIVVMGIYSIIYIPIDLYPEIDPPFVSVITSYPGADAGEIEINVTRPLEDAFIIIDNLVEISSESSDGVSVISLEFEWDADLNEATNDVRDAIDFTYDALPEAAERPNIFKFDIAMMPVVIYAITADESYQGLGPILDEELISPLSRIDGVGSINLLGEPERRIYVETDPVQMDAYDITNEQIGDLIAAENINLPSGNIKMGMMDYPLRIEGEFRESYELKDLVLGHFEGRTVFLGDVARIRDTLRDLTLEERIDGEQGVRMMITRQAGANTVRIAGEVSEAITELEENLPPDVEIREIIDTSVFISDAVNNLTRTLFWALLFVVLVVLFFVGKLTATFIVAVTIPIALIVSFIYLFTTDGSINIISLASLSIALGMVVDDAIVVLENITRYIDRGAGPREAAIYATNEVWLAVLVTTMVIVAVFFPLTLLGGMTGVLFTQLGWIVSITVVTSTLAAISLTPMLSSQLLKLKKKEREPRRFSHERIAAPLLNRLERFYEKTIHLVLGNKRKVIFVSLAIFISSFLLLRFIGTEFLPEADESRLDATLELATGTRVEETVKVGRQMEGIIAERYPEVEILSVSSGAAGAAGMAAIFGETEPNMIDITMRLVPVDQRERSVWEIAADLRRQIERIPEVVEYSVSAAGMGAQMGDPSVDLEIFGYDFEDTRQVAEDIATRLEEVDGAEEIEISRKDERPGLQIVLDRSKLAVNGLNTVMVATAIRNRVDGITASLFREAGEEYDIVVRLGEYHRSSVSDLEAITISTPVNGRVSLNEVGEVSEYWSPPGIERMGRERVVMVSAVPTEISQGELADEMISISEEIDVPDGVSISIGGAYEDQVEAFRDLGLLLVVSFILVFLIMASQFESFVMPFVIMFSVPFSFTGVFLALLITNTTLSVIAGLGAVLLIGIVVKNGIVLVDYINLMRDRGIRLNEAIATSGRRRLRPVLMTAVTTILAMVPLALSTGEGAEIWRPMGITIIGGLLFSTVVTLIIIPAVYGIFARRGERDKLQKVRKTYTFLDEC